MIILVLFSVVPLAAGILAQYAVCRFPKRRVWRYLPPVLVVLLAAAIGMGRYRVWTSTAVAPWTQIILFPGVPAIFLLLGLFLGWRLWKWLWRPKVIRDRKK